MRHRDITRDPTYLSILSFINEKGSARPAELAEKYNITRQAMDHRLKKMEEEQLIIKEYGEKGRVYIRISEKGKEILERELYSKEESQLEIKKSLDLNIVIITVFTILGIGGLLYFYILLNDLIRGIYSLVMWIVIGLAVIHYYKKRG
jgi:CTP-dependent riboflavin kinase